MAKRRGMMIDPDRCIGCRSCQVACKEWNELPAEGTVNRGSFENPPDLSHRLYNRIRFIESPGAEGLDWLFFSQRCVHCGDAPCVNVCPSGALHYSEFGTIAVDQERCISCKYCVAACPFGVPRYDERNRISKCHFCEERIANGLEPSCSQACPTDALRYDLWDRLQEDVMPEGKKLYGASALGGMGVMYALSNDPEVYGLPEKPEPPVGMTAWRDFVRKLGWFGFWGAIGGALIHYVTIGPKRLRPEETEGGD